MPENTLSFWQSIMETTEYFNVQDIYALAARIKIFMDLITFPVHNCPWKSIEY